MVWAGIVLPPAARNPEIAGDEEVAVQLKLDPAIFENKVTLDDFAPEQMVCDMEALFTTGAGLIVTK
jgi:hypothetical protein